MTEAELLQAVTTIRESMRRALRQQPPQIPSAAWIFSDLPDRRSQVAQVFFPARSLVASMVKQAIERYHGHAVVIVQPVMIEKTPALALQWSNATTCRGATAQKITYTPLTGVVFHNVEPHPCPVEDIDTLLTVGPIIAPPHNS